ncbi:MAG: helix-turn-helix domain-containing protein [Chloroflexota bacterium]|nr:helix-turn-helix domain-containing protein [Chloroflexota bacterium]
MVVDGNRLRNQREQRFWSQQELARRSGVSRITIARIETGVVVPTLMTVRRLAEAMGVEPVEIVPDPSALRRSRRATRPAEGARNGGAAR